MSLGDGHAAPERTQGSLKARGSALEWDIQKEALTEKLSLMVADIQTQGTSTSIEERWAPWIAGA